MRVSSPACRRVPFMLLAALLACGLAWGVSAQSQEPKPGGPSSRVTPAASPEAPATAVPASGVREASWVGPNWGLRITWDPASWTVENELIEPGYDGLQLGTPASTVFIEAYEGFGGDAAACLADAEREIGERERVVEVAPLRDRTLPETGPNPGPSRLFGIIAELPDGERYRGVEYVECRTLVPGTAVLELTWQAPVASYNSDLPRVNALMAMIGLPEMPVSGVPGTPPAATPVA